MKKIVLTLGLFAGLTAFSFAQEGHSANDGHNHGTAVQQPTTPVSTADIKMDKMVHDYGNVMQGGNGECEFKFTNNGKEPLVITNCMGSCGCTVPQCPKEPILPGKSGVVKVKYDTNRVGGIYKTVTVNSNAKSGNMVLTIKGNIEAKPVEVEFPENKTPTGAPVEKKG
ncbi:MAG: DUF1573 domain-containing protein [Bacteroidota bacterium]|mgnify:CR=1 FL=1|nr:DUF1573 domain-containing protein [Bacteroidota bacterium]